MTMQTVASTLSPEDVSLRMQESGFHDAFISLEKYGFFTQNLTFSEERKGFIFFAPKMKKTTEKTNPFNIKHFFVLDLENKYFWFQKLTPIIINTLIDVIPYWKANTMKEFNLSGKKTGKDNDNAVKIKDLPAFMSNVALEIDKLTGASMDAHPSWLAENLMLYQDMLNAVTTNVSDLTRKRLVSCSLFIEKGFNYEDCQLFIENKILFEDAETNGIDLGLPAEWIVAALKKSE